MDTKFIKALCHAYGNYREAIASVDDSEDASRLPHVVSTGKALLELQRALDFEVADNNQVRLAIEEARNAYINRP